MPGVCTSAIADLNSAVKPQLTIVDAIRILTANGPTGGNLDDVKRLDTIIASADVVAADAYAAGLFGMKPPTSNTSSSAPKWGWGRWIWAVFGSRRSRFERGA